MNENKLANIYNFLQIDDAIATSGQPKAEEFEEIKNSGYQTVINLALTNSSNALDNEPEIVKSRGMEYIHIPVIWEKPTLKDFQTFVKVIDDNPERKLFVHCAANKRVSVFIYLYRLQKGVDRALAQKDLEAIWKPNQVWQNFIDCIIN